MLLGDAGRTSKIARLRLETQATMNELERNKHLLRLRLDDTLRGIAAQREELQRMEEMAIAEMEREDKEYQILAGKSVEDTIASSVVSFSTAIDFEDKTMTRLDYVDGRHEDYNEEDQPEDEWDTMFQDL
ncbi:hypothetical protein FALCPG4_015440 [Fusarium falciforme]